MGEEIAPEELRAALRRATLASIVVPVFCGTALRNKGIQPLLDGIVDYLPAPLDVSAVEGLHPATKKAEIREPSHSEPFAALCFKVQMIPLWDG